MARDGYPSGKPVNLDDVAQPAPGPAPGADMDGGVMLVAETLCSGRDEHFTTAWPCRDCLDTARRVVTAQQSGRPNG